MEEKQGIRKQVTPREVRSWLSETLRNRRDLGVTRAIAAGVLDPENPFEPGAVRRPQKWFVLATAICLLTAGCFVYFNFWR
jgi:hypothetical protein